VFPSGAKCGHLEQGTGKTQHTRAIAKINEKTVKENYKRATLALNPLPLPLTRLSPMGCVTRP